MDIFTKLIYPHPKKPLILTMGNFDGVHLGHQQLLKKTISLAKQYHTASGVITFQKSPATLFYPQAPIENISSQGQKTALLEKLGIDIVFLLDFTKEFAAQSPKEFLSQLKDGVPFSHLLLGHDAKFGKNREGDPAVITALSKTLNFEVEYLPPFKYHDQIISSRLIRQEIKAGRLDEAKSMLGRPYAIQSKVAKGSGTGQRIGFPTANLPVNNYCLPPFGVWAVTANGHPAIANLGVAPTVRQDSTPLLEVHLFDHESPLYDQEIEVIFLTHLRSEKRFPSLDALKKQIERDVETAKGYFRLIANS
jgi:riboflavin kinase / FMN adenylyltransferase